MKKQIKIENLIKKLKEHQKELEKKFGIIEIKVFGSYIKNKQTSKSDLDIIVEFKETPGFIKFMKVEEYLSKLLGVKVDLLTREGISPYIRKYIEKEAISI